ncbi:hypothetical protein HDZ31DRAFT_63814 [Schizophyllum fasciatum]
MSLAKAPLLLSIIWGISHSLTPPNGTAPRDRSLVARHPVERYFVPRMHILRDVLCAVSIIEIAVIVAGRSPDAPFGSLVLRTLDPGGEAQNLRITAPFAVGCTLNLVGSLIRATCYRALDRAYTFQLTLRDEQKLITSGVYAAVRHPGYAGGYLAVGGWFLAQVCSGSWLWECACQTPSRRLGASLVWVLAVLPGLAGFAHRMRAEDRMLRERFGEAWEEWATRVPHRLVPGVW